MIRKAMIFAAGLGTRLRPLTDTMPKALVPVCGTPLIAHVARRLMSFGIDEAVVNVHHFADMIEEWISSRDWICSRYEDMKPGMMLMQVSDERQGLLETGGAVLHARPLLEGCGRFLIHNVDIFSDCDFRWLDSQVRADAVATLLVSSRETSRYLLFHPQTMRLAGWKNVKTGQVIMADASLAPQQCRSLAFTGIHVMSDSIFDLMVRYVKEKGVPPGDAGARFSIVDFYLWAAASQPVYGVEAHDLRLLDIGKLDALSPAEDFLEKI